MKWKIPNESIPGFTVKLTDKFCLVLIVTPMETYLCIVGFAISGISVARWAKAAGLDYVVLEKSSTFGGVWIHKSYDNILLQTTKFSYSYSDYPMPDSVSLHPSREEILTYLGTYVYQHQLHDKVRYNQEVVSVDRLSELPNRPHRSGYQVYVKNTTSGGVYSIICEKIAVCSGLYTTPHIPPTLPLHHFQGIVAHSEKFAVGQPYYQYNYSGKHVVVIGNGPTGCDLAVNAYDAGAKSVTLLYRTPRWLFTRYLGTLGLNFFSNRFFLWVGINLPVPIFIAVLYLIFYLPYYLFGFRKGLDLPTTVVNRHNLSMNEKILRYINTDRLSYLQATQIQATGRHLEYLHRGQEQHTPCDMLILATGYRHGIPFLGHKLLYFFYTIF